MDFPEIKDTGNLIAICFERVVGCKQALLPLNDWDKNHCVFFHSPRFLTSSRKFSSHQWNVRDVLGVRSVGPLLRPKNADFEYNMV